MPNDNVHELTLDYTNGANGPKVTQPPNIRVRAGHAIRFKRGAVPPGFKVVIIFSEPQFFSSALFDEGQADISVQSNLPHSTFYQCGLRAPDGHVIPETLSGPNSGGQIDPAGDTGN